MFRAPSTSRTACSRCAGRGGAGRRLLPSCCHPPGAKGGRHPTAAHLHLAWQRALILLLHLHMLLHIATNCALHCHHRCAQVGRAPPADIVIAIPTVSSRHAMLRVVGGSQVLVSDLGSTNGTFVDGKELTAMQAVSGWGWGWGCGGLCFGSAWLRFALLLVGGVAVCSCLPFASVPAAEAVCSCSCCAPAGAGAAGGGQPSDVWG